MIKKLIFTSFLIMGSYIDGAELEPFESMCTSNGATGFNWDENHWRQTDFKLKKFLVKKIKNISIKEVNIKDDYEKYFLASICKEHVNEKPLVDKEAGITYYSVCISTKDVDSKFWHPNKCYETHYSDDFGAEFKQFLNHKGKIKFTCETGITTNLVFAKNGNFTEIKSHADIFEPTEQKESLAITVGTCSDITINQNLND